MRPARAEREELMTNVVLTHSYHLANDPKQLRKMQPYAPLGTLYAAAALRSADISVAVFDTTLQDPLEAFAHTLRRHRPSIVVIYEDDFNFLSKMCLTSVRATAKRIAQIAQATGAIVIAHGSDASDHAADYLEAGVDYVLTGEAEQTLAELCKHLLTAQPIESIPGVLRRDARGHLLHSSSDNVKNTGWAQIPRAARELIDLEPYRQAWTSAHGYFSANVVSSRGCPYQCNWCAKPISGNKFQVRPAEAVVAEIRELKELYGVQHIWFGDDIFALNRKWTEEFADAMQKQNCILPFKIQSRADLMTQATVDALARAGCAEVWMGIESGSQKILDAMEKGLRVTDVRGARERLADAGIRACYFLQFGYPGESWAEIQQTLSLVRSTRPDDIGVSVSYPLPGTSFYERVRAQIGVKRNWTDSDDLCVMFTAAYNNEFYLNLRDALHAEVDSWKPNSAVSAASVRAAWERLLEYEQYARNQDVTKLTAQPISSNRATDFVPIQRLSSAGGPA
jgi:anaerobic magnesium-protoporphyrin IX monomethyl ester cyclase